MARIPDTGSRRTDEEIAKSMATSTLKHNYYMEHNCYPGSECGCVFCQEYLSRIPVPSWKKQDANEIIENIKRGANALLRRK